MFIRGSVVRYVMLPRSEVDVGLLEDATRRGEFAMAGSASDRLRRDRYTG